MLSYPTDVLDLLDEGRIIVRGLLEFRFGGGTYRFAKSLVPIVWGGNPYLPGGIINVSDLSGGTGTAARQFTITLAASPDDGLTPEILQTIEAEDYKDRPVIIYDAHFHPDTNALIDVRAMRRGYLDVIDHVEDENGYTIVCNCETRALDYTRTNGRKRNHADQQRRKPGDKFLEHASTRGREEVLWGRTKQS